MPIAWCRKRAAAPRRSMQNAEAYREQTVAEATGQTSRFNAGLREYAKAPQVTRQRMYLETMERLLGGTDKIILDSGAGAGQGIVPYLSAQRIGQAARAAASQSQSAPQQQQQQPQLSNSRAARRDRHESRYRGRRDCRRRGRCSAFVGYSAIFTVHEGASGAGGAARRPDPRGQQAGPAFQSAVHRQRHLRRQAHPRSGKSAAGKEIIASDQKRLVVDAFARYQHRRSAALLSGDRRAVRSRAPTAIVDTAEFGAAARARRSLVPGCGARRARQC